MKKFSWNEVALIILMLVTIVLAAVTDMKNIVYTFADVCMSLIFIFGIVVFLIRRLGGVDNVDMYSSLARAAMAGFIVKAAASGFIVINFNGWHMYEVLTIAVGIISLATVIGMEINIFRKRRATRDNA